MHQMNKSISARISVQKRKSTIPECSESKLIHCICSGRRNDASPRTRTGPDQWWTGTCHIQHTFNHSPILRNSSVWVAFINITCIQCILKPECIKSCLFVQRFIVSPMHYTFLRWLTGFGPCISWLVLDRDPKRIVKPKSPLT